MRNFIFILSIPLILASCSEKDEPTLDVYSQVSEISKGKSYSGRMEYDSYGRVIKYDVTSTDETICCSYSYPSENRMSIRTRQVIRMWDNHCIIREFEDEMTLENGRAALCEGIFTNHEENDGDEQRRLQNKYRHEFVYTPDNHLNVVKWTEWSKRGDEWALDRPWSWENYYIWENGNLSTVEDFHGKSKPYYTYRYTYSTISGVQNIVPIPFGRTQYFPLQLKGLFGAQPNNLISGVELEEPGQQTIETTYEYTLTDSRVTKYTETRNGVTEDYEVSWIQR